MLSREKILEILKKLLESNIGTDVEEDISALNLYVEGVENLIEQAYYSTLTDTGERIDFRLKNDGAGGEDFEAKYNDLKSKYIARFFGGNESAVDVSEGNTVKPDGLSDGMEGEEAEPPGIESLFEAKEDE